MVHKVFIVDATMFRLKDCGLYDNEIIGEVSKEKLKKLKVI
jgi:hypothetical protein